MYIHKHIHRYNVVNTDIQTYTVTCMHTHKCHRHNHINAQTYSHTYIITTHACTYKCAHSDVCTHPHDSTGDLVCGFSEFPRMVLESASWILTWVIAFLAWAPDFCERRKLCLMAEKGPCLSSQAFLFCFVFSNKSSFHSPFGTSTLLWQVPGQHVVLLTQQLWMWRGHCPAVTITQCPAWVQDILLCLTLKCVKVIPITRCWSPPSPPPTTHTCKYPYEKFFWANQSFSLLIFLYHTLNAGQDKTWSLPTLSV